MGNIHVWTPWLEPKSFVWYNKLKNKSSSNKIGANPSESSIS